MPPRHRYALPRAIVASTVASILACTPAPAPKPPPPVTIVAAAPASGDFDWSFGETRHPLRAGAAFLGVGGALELVLADGDVSSPCDIVGVTADPSRGPERVRVHVPRGLDEPWPLHRAISPGALLLQPLAGTAADEARRVARWELELESIAPTPGGRVTGRLAWIGPSSGASSVGAGAAAGESRSFGEGRFDLPLCASQPELDAVASLPPTRAIDPGAAPLHGTTSSGAFTSARAFAVIRPWFGLPPHPIRIELVSDPLASCATRRDARGTALLVDVDSGTGLGAHDGSRQPVGAVECRAGTTTWDCLGAPAITRGFVEVHARDLRVGGHLRGSMAIAGGPGTLVAGAFDAELCAD